MTAVVIIVSLVLVLATAGAHLACLAGTSGGPRMRAAAPPTWLGITVLGCN